MGDQIDQSFHHFGINGKMVKMAASSTIISQLLFIFMLNQQVRNPLVLLTIRLLTLTYVWHFLTGGMFYEEWSNHNIKPSI